jgi:hypothetical protein
VIDPSFPIIGWGLHESWEFKAFESVHVFNHESAFVVFIILLKTHGSNMLLMPRFLSSSEYLLSSTPCGFHLVPFSGSRSIWSFQF